jgi:tetratricopeptide (TPR) repeat protein
VKRQAGLVLLLVTTATAQVASQNFEDISKEAAQAYEADHLEEASQLFKQAVELRSDWAQGWWAIGMIAYQRDQYAECRDALARMVQLDSSAPPGWALLGLCEFRTKEFDRSFEHLKRAHMLVPATERTGSVMNMAEFHLSMLLTRQGAFELAQEFFMRLARIAHNDNPEMTFASGVAALRMPMLPDDVPSAQRDVVAMAGKAFWDLAIQEPQVVEADFKALVAKYPKFPSVHYFYGTYLAAHRPDECAAEFLKELSVTPDSVPARVELTLRYILEKKIDRAIKLAREAVALSPESVGTHLALAKALHAKGDEPGALASYKKAEQLDPVSPQIRLYIVNTYRALDRIADMRKEMAEYNRLKAEQPNWP